MIGRRRNAVDLEGAPLEREGESSDEDEDAEERAPHAYGVHLQYQGYKRWWTQARWEAVIGLRLSGCAEKHEDFRQDGAFLITL